MEGRNGEDEDEVPAIIHHFVLSFLIPSRVLFLLHRIIYFYSQASVLAGVLRMFFSIFRFIHISIIGGSSVYSPSFSKSSPDRPVIYFEI